MPPPERTFVPRAFTFGIVIHRCERPVEARNEYHFLITRTGQTLPCLPVMVKGAHAYKANATTIGIAVEGCFCSGYKARNNFVTPPQMSALVSCVQALQIRFAIPRIRVLRHLDLGIDGTTDMEKLVLARSCPGDLFPWTEFQAQLLPKI